MFDNGTVFDFFLFSCMFGTIQKAENESNCSLLSSKKNCISTSLILTTIYTGD